MRAQRMAVVQGSRGGAILLSWRRAFAPAGLLLALLLAACGASTPALPSSPGGTYTNAQFQFSVTYPSGWLPNELSTPLGSPQATPTASLAIPLTVVITQTSTDQIESALLSSFTITVLDADNPAIASSIAKQKAQASGANPTLKTITLTSQTAWQAQPVTKQLPNSDKSATHTDYYLLHGTYEFQLSTDSIAGGGSDAALAAMLKSFAFTA
jgi:hypothetical protein